jgi:hypothetical protein
MDEERVEGCTSSDVRNDDNDCDIVLEVSDDNNFEDDVLTLRDYSFITLTSDSNTLEMHSLVQLATQTWLENQG